MFKRTCTRGLTSNVHLAPSQHDPSTQVGLQHKYEYEIVRDRYAKPETFETLEDCTAELVKLPSTSSDPRDEQIEQLKAEVAKLQKQLATAIEKNG